MTSRRTPAVLLFLSDEPNPEGVQIELHAVVGDLEPQHLGKGLIDGAPRLARRTRAVQADDASRKSSRSFA